MSMEITFKTEIDTCNAFFHRCLSQGATVSDNRMWKIGMRLVELDPQCDGLPGLWQ